MSVTVYIDIMKQTWCSIAQSRTRKKKLIILKNEHCSIFVLCFCYMFFFLYVYIIAFFFRRNQWATASAICKSQTEKITAIKTVWQVKYATMFSCNFKRRNNPIKYCDNEYAMSIPIAQCTHFLFGSEKL